jgi:Outer membrane protein beta-barrel domain
MKKTILLFVLIPTCLFSQKVFKGGVKVGISTTQVAGDTYSGFHKAGIVGGLTLNAKLSSVWSLQTEMFFIQKGSKHNGNAEAGDLSFYYLNLNYLEVPLLLHYKVKKFTVELGAAYGYLINTREYDEYQELTGIWPFNKNEWSVCVGFSYNLFKRLGINWRYTNSVLFIRDFPPGSTAWFNQGQRNNVLAFSLTYSFTKPDASK